MINPNQRVQGPFGDIYTPNISATDRLSQQLYAEQKQKEQQQLLENRRLDDEFARNMSGIRDVDIPDLTKSYGDWKLANQMLYKQKDGITPQQQLDVLRKKADMYDVINRSKAVRAKELEVRKLGDTHADNLNDDWQARLSASMKTPLSKGNDFMDYNHIYDGNTYKKGAEDYTKAVTGALHDIEDGGTPLDSKGISKEFTKYKAINPKKVQEYYLGRMLDRDANKNYTYQLKTLPPDELIKTDAAFKSIPPDQLALMGIKPSDLAFDRTDDNAHVMATYLAQKAALQNLPIKVGTRKEDNTLKKFDYELAERNKNAIGLQYLKDKLIRGRAKDGSLDLNQIGYPTEDLNNQFGQDYNGVSAVKGMEGTPVGVKRVVYVNDIGTKVHGMINPTDENKAIYPVAPAEIQQPDGTFKKAFFYDPKTKDFIGKEGKHISAEDARNSFIKEAVPTKFKLQTVTNKPTLEAKQSKTVSSATIKGLVGKKGYEGYTEKEIADYYKSNGYEIK